ncbi:MAG: hypothetical protein ACJA0G_001930 [Kangiellaceae bacterium]|jgi:hypothetical protein
MRVKLQYRLRYKFLFSKFNTLFTICDHYTYDEYDINLMNVVCNPRFLRYLPYYYPVIVYLLL